ncbi:MAG: hypothetical protein IT373_15045 [Polyangiaceae bacterium]|nr:hypothetical protein [Polyangiaceae bacterium]
MGTTSDAPSTLPVQAAMPKPCGAAVRGPAAKHPVMTAAPAKIVLVPLVLPVVVACDLRVTPPEPALPRPSASRSAPALRPAPRAGVEVTAWSWDADEPVVTGVFLGYRQIHGRVVIDDALLQAWSVLGVEPAGVGCGALVRLTLQSQMTDASTFWDLARACGGVVDDIGGGRFRVCRRFPAPACASRPSDVMETCAGDFDASFFHEGVRPIGWCNGVGLYARPLGDAAGMCLLYQFEAGGFALRVGHGRYVVLESRDHECLDGHWVPNWQAMTTE